MAELLTYFYLRRRLCTVYISDGARMYRNLRFNTSCIASQLKRKKPPVRFLNRKDPARTWRGPSKLRSSRPMPRFCCVAWLHGII